MDLEQTQLLIYQHVVQLTLIDHSVEDAFALAHEVAALAFDETFTRRGLALAARGHGETLVQKPASESDATPAPRTGDEV